MNATEIMAVALLLAVLGRWEHGKATMPNGKAIIEVVFALLVIAFLDQGRTQPLARGFALLFLVAVLLGSNSPISGLAKANVVPAPAAGGNSKTSSTPNNSRAGGGRALSNS